MSLWGKLKKTVKKAVSGKNIFKGTPFEGIARAVGKGARKAASSATGGMSETALKTGMAMAKGKKGKKAKKGKGAAAIAATPLAGNAPVSSPVTALETVAAPTAKPQGIIEAILSAFGLG